MSLLRWVSRRRPLPRTLATHDLTIGVPVHRGLRWSNVISENLANVPADATILISDCTREDACLRELRRRHRRDRRVRFTQGDVSLGWREHINQLILSSRSAAFSILPQDDSVAEGHYESLIDALNASPAAVLAFPRLVGEYPDGSQHDHRPIPFALGHEDVTEEALRLWYQWNLGVPWRGIVRKPVLRPMLPTPGDQWADQLWVFGIALEGHLLEVPHTIYRKRYHDGNTHGNWDPPTAAAVLAMQLAEVDRRFIDRPELHQRVRKRVIAAAPS